MTTPLTRALFFVALAALLACHADASAPPPEGDTPWGPCPSGFHDECRTLTLPLDPAAPDGAKVPVFIARALSYTPSHADLWLLQGGPGDSAEVFEELVDQIRSDVPGVDVYTMEQRGVGQSARLGCPDQESPSSDEGTSISTAEIPACLAAVEKQWPNGGLQHFRVTPTANDLAQVIDRTKTSGHQVFVYGVSYGTTVAIRYLQLRPNDATGVILDSIAPAGIEFFSRFSAQYDPVLQSLSLLCAGDPGCAARFDPDPWTVLSRVTGGVEAGKCAAAHLTKESLSRALETLLQSDLLRVPGMALLRRVDRCAPEDVPAIQSMTDFLAAVDGRPSPRVSQLLYWNIVGSDLWESPAPSIDELEQRCDALSICGEGSIDNGKIRALWPTYPRDPLAGRPVTTRSAVLMMNGVLDPQTPLHNAVALDAQLTSPHKTLVTLPYSAHDTVAQALANATDEPPCGLAVLESFLRNPAAPDTSCATRTRDVSFASDPAQAKAYFGTSDLWDNDPDDAGDAGEE